MAFIEIQRRCDDCEKTRAELAVLRSEVQRALLDYENLYDKVRTNLGKLAKRAKLDQDESSNGTEGDPMAKYRAQLVERKLAKMKG